MRRLLEEFKSSERHVCELMAVSDRAAVIGAGETIARFRSGCASWRGNIRALVIDACICTCMRRWE